ncbi:MAG: hypothetical protein J6X36_10380 [Lachnospiraceae bacterium]|nr:hypothetical protein [Lachnospiraceae bacterium]
MKNKSIPFIKGFLTAYAMRATIDVPLRAEWYESARDYVIGNVFALLGEYDFVFLFYFAVCTVFYFFMEGKSEKNRALTVLSLIFALLVPIGQCARDFKTVSYIFLSAVNVIKFILITIGFAMFFTKMLGFLKEFFQKKNFLKTNEDKPGFFDKKPFLKAYILLFSVYALITLICYPGNINADTIGQIYQVYGEMPYSEHHPILSTLLVGGLVKLFDNITGSQAPGLFAYTLLQCALLAAALSFTVYVLAKKGLKNVCLWTLTLLYAITPVYTNIVSTAIKDVPFMAFVIVYAVLSILYIEDNSRITDVKFFVGLIVSGIFMVLLRNNGIYMMVPTGIVLWLYGIKKKTAKEKVMSFVGLFFAAAVLGMLINTGLSKAVNAEKGAKGEMLSLTFQMLGRYYTEFPDDFTDKDREAIAGVLGPIDNSLDGYNPDLADQIKVKYRSEATTGEIVAYLKTFTRLFFKHPGAYIDGFAVHTYGWVSPMASNEKRYETPDDDFLTPTGVFEVIDKGMVFLYRFLNRISILGALENVAFWVWVYAFLFVLQKEKNLRKYRLFGVYMLIALLICFAAPAFLEHVRYGFPILMTVPFVFFFTLCIKDKEVES